jgi:hypothetical protein
MVPTPADGNVALGLVESSVAFRPFITSIISFAGPGAVPGGVLDALPGIKGLELTSFNKGAKIEATTEYSTMPMTIIAANDNAITSSFIFLFIMFHL